MSDHRPKTSFSDTWLAWLRDYSQAAEHLLEEVPLIVASPEESQPLNIKISLYARILTIFRGALLFAEHNRQLDFRIHARGVIEATMYMIALDSDPEFVSRMRNDDIKSRHDRAKLCFDGLAAGSNNLRQKLEEFITQNMKRTERIALRDLVKETDFNRLYLTFRNISADAAHVSFESLRRHIIEDDDNQSAALIIDPTLGNPELNGTLMELGISMTIATLMLMKIAGKTDVWDEFRDLLFRYGELSSFATRSNSDNE